MATNVCDNNNNDNNSEELRNVFHTYCKITNKNNDKGNGSTIKKICSDANVVDSKLNQNTIDIEYCKCFGNAKGFIDADAFIKFIDVHLGKIYAQTHKLSEADAIDKVKQMISNAKPKLSQTTKTSGNPVTSRLTDIKTYTGMHKERFDEETGKGKGKSGREYLLEERAAEGYVTGYKNKDSYDKK